MENEIINKTENQVKVEQRNHSAFNKCIKCVNMMIKQVCFDCYHYSEQNRINKCKDFFHSKNEQLNELETQNHKFFSIRDDPDNKFIYLSIRDLNAGVSKPFTELKLSLSQANILQIHLYRLIKIKKGMK